MSRIDDLIEELCPDGVEFFLSKKFFSYVMATRHQSRNESTGITGQFRGSVWRTLERMGAY